MSDKLIRRDTPLKAGTKIEVRTITNYTIDVDDWLDGASSVTAAEIEDGLRNFCGSHCMSIVEGLQDHGYKGEFIEHELCPEQSDIGIRFETEWEQRERSLGGFEKGYCLVKPEQYEEAVEASP